jgi:hypothetical protein
MICISVIIWMHCIWLYKSVGHYVVEDHWLTRPQYGIVVWTTITVSFAGTKAGAVRLWTWPLVCRCYIQWLCNACATCGTYAFIWMYFIVSKQMVIILYIEFVQLALMCYCKRKMSSAVNLYSDDVIVDVITIRGNSKFSLTPFCKKWVGTVWYQRGWLWDPVNL